ncbi:hypothetical protein KEM56_007836 [Ascosphaera pollenicola]|nr:hypothetical protein KEM56_007836 [Ascosphaera pollenicola]
MPRLTDTPEHLPLREVSTNVLESIRPQVAETGDAKAQNAQSSGRHPRKSKTVPAFSSKDAAIDGPLEFGEPLLPPTSYSRRRHKPPAPDLSRRHSASHQHDKDSNTQGLPVPIPPLSVPTYLQLELASGRPSEAYIHRSRRQDIVYESNAVKLERLQNFLLLPLTLEHVFTFGTFACLDAWLYSFTILPLRFLKALSILCQSWAINAGNHLKFLIGSASQGFREWEHKRRTIGKDSGEREEVSGDSEVMSHRPLRHNEEKEQSDTVQRPYTRTGPYRHRRTRSVPSTLLPDDKADILKSLLIIFTCILLMRFDASKAYHNIRGQAAIKLYVIFNVLEVFDRLLSAIGQDVLECLFSREALERDSDGRSKILRPFSLFMVALMYTVIHSSALFYQVITLNVAVNSYSNALITLLMSNQFVEIKSTVFKKFEKENLFQLTCADVVERFQLWLMLTIIASRNVVETGSFSFFGGLTSLASYATPNTNTGPTAKAAVTQSAPSILPKAFTLLPSISSSLSCLNSIIPMATQVLGPFFVVLGSEMLVDWLKHAYINKFNNNRPIIYSRFLDILAKDYYTNAFGNQNLTRRLGLPIIPLVCLFFRISVQTYQMFLATWIPPSSSLEPSSTLSLTSIHEQYSSLPSPSTALGASTPVTLPLSVQVPQVIVNGYLFIQRSFKELATYVTPSPSLFVPIFTIILLLLLYSILLLAKLVLGIVLLSYSRSRYTAMKAQERHMERQYSSKPEHQQPSPPTNAHLPPHAEVPIPSANMSVEGARRFGPLGAVEVDEDKRRWIYADEPETVRRHKDRETRPSSHRKGSLENVRRYDMAAKRIW